MVYVYTSINGAYLANARILAQSIKKYHPDWRFVLLYSDTNNVDINWTNQPFDEVLFAHKLPIESFRNWAFKYNIIELCTAVKGVAAQYLFDSKGAEKVIYLDPDTVVFSKMDEVLKLLDEHIAILTPHITDAANEEAGIFNHEMAALKHGTFNLGFYAFNSSKESRVFLDWWAHRIQHYAYADFQAGLFTDQKWCNLAPYLFDNICILAESNYNVATWNINNRKITYVNNKWLVNDKPLKFYHFSGFGNNFKWADRELEIFTEADDELRHLWKWYKKQYSNNKIFNLNSWFWGKYENGEEIQQLHRKLYREDLDLQKLYPNPYSNSFYMNVIGNKWFN